MVPFLIPTLERLHGHYACRTIAAYKPNPLPCTDRNISSLGNNACFTVIKAHGNFQALSFSCPVFHGITRHCAQQAATYRSQYVATASAYGIAGNTTQGTTSQNPSTTALVRLYGYVANELYSSGTDDLLALRLPIVVNR